MLTALQVKGFVAELTSQNCRGLDACSQACSLYHVKCLINVLIRGDTYVCPNTVTFSAGP